VSRVVVVTGGAKGIGKAVAERFAGDQVHAPGHDELDVTDEARCRHVFDELGRVDVLVNNAGVALGAPLVRTTLDDWRAHLDVNATGAFLCTRAVLGGMIERGDGRIVTVASVAGLAARATPPRTARRSTLRSGSCGRPRQRSRAPGDRKRGLPRLRATRT
jgi:NAD(P)-dependent dehydrogenase (short-subunit alcohol dehydrogenase family)